MTDCDWTGCNKEAIGGFEETATESCFDTTVTNRTYGCEQHRGDMSQKFHGNQKGTSVDLLYYVVQYGRRGEIEHKTIGEMTSRWDNKETRWFGVPQTSRADAEALLASLKAEGTVD
jgi:hypothetical protein